MARTTPLPVSVSLAIICVLVGTALALPAPIPEIAPLPPEDPSQRHDTVVCIYPISGTYGFLPRLLYYASLILAILGRYQQWLVLGALASALSYAGTAAIHLIVLVKSRENVFDLDILGAWAVVSSACLAFVALVHWSSTIHESRSRLVLVLWGCLVGIGCIFGNTELRNMDTRSLPACRSESGELFTSLADSIDPQFSKCSYECFSAANVIRDPEEIIAIPSRIILEGYLATLGAVLFPMVLMAAYKSVSLNMNPHTPSMLCIRFVMLYTNDSHNPRLAQQSYNTACQSWYGGYMMLFHYIHKAKYATAKKGLITAILIYPWILLELFLDLIAPFLFAVNIIINEITLMNTGLPLEEEYHSVGQWGPLVSAGLVILAAIINKGMEVHESKKALKDAEKENQRKGTELEDLPSKPAPSESSPSPSPSSSSVPLPPEAHRVDTSTSAYIETVTNIPKRS
ncbi:hypothetical protein FQN54_005249 [Arachnomyces sp. PD_36]|nr:hypothetical protein FQN54_005249 [Arachnomyces sp. PD_36]